MHAQNFADELRVLAALDNNAASDSILNAFKSVPREDFAGQGPWKLRSALAGVSRPASLTPDANPKWLYHSVLVVLDEDKGINIGDPSLWADVLAKADVKSGSRILQVGAGVGYYTAILSELVGPSGRIVAYEVEQGLVRRAKLNLANYENVVVRHGNAATDLEDIDHIDLVISFAGVTHIPEIWTSRLASDGRVLLPLTGEDCWGAMILARQSDEGFDAMSLGRCGFYPCSGARRDDLAAQVSDMFSETKRLRDWPIRIIGTDEDIRFVA